MEILAQKKKKGHASREPWKALHTAVRTGIDDIPGAICSTFSEYNPGAQGN